MMNGKLLMPVEWGKGLYRGGGGDWVLVFCQNDFIARILQINRRSWDALICGFGSDDRVGTYKTLKEAKLAIEKKLGIKRIRVLSYESHN